MALGKTIIYTPFQETSFGYGSGEIASAHSTEFPNATDIVKVTIGFQSGTNWDSTTGHIATPSSGTAVSTFNKFNNEWIVRGERDDVDAVLAQLKFFPSDYSSTRTWTPTELKDNQTTGLYADENPPSIPDTDINLRVYDNTDTVISTNAVTFEADSYNFNNQRPYWSVEPATQEVSALGIPPRIDLGTLAHGSDTEHVQVKCEFRNWNSTSTYVGTTYGSFTSASRIYVGDKVEGTTNTGNSLFNFTGSLTEAQAFLDNIGYERSSNDTTFDMFLTVTDGEVGSTLTKTCWFADSTIGVSTLPNQSYTEDNSAWIDLGLVSFSNVNPDVTDYSCTLTFDSTAQTGISHGYAGNGTYTNGVLTFSSNDLNSLKTTMNGIIEIYHLDDFNSDYTFTVDFTFSNPTLGTTYSSVQQTINVSATPVDEVSNLNTSHTYVEDRSYDFTDGLFPQIIHPINRDFEVNFTLSDATAGILSRHGSTGTWVDNGSGSYTLSGSKTEVNTALQNLYFAPNPDYFADFSISYTVDRTSGDLTFATQSSGSFTMTGTADPNEYSFTASTLNWIEDTSKGFNTQIEITDSATDGDVELPAYGTNYTVYMKAVDALGNDYNTGSLTSTSTGGATGNAADANPKSYTGTKAQVNQAIANMKYVPDVDQTDAFFIQFKIVREYDSYTVVDYNASSQITFNSAQLDGVYSRTAQTNIDWTEDTLVSFDSGITITDLATDNPDISNYYQTTYTATARAKDSDGNDLTTAIWATTSYGSATVSGYGTVAEPLIVTGSKTDVNTALANLQMAPDIDWISSPSTDGRFYLQYKIERDEDSVTLINYNEVSTFNEGTDVPEYTTAFNATYTEDVPEQYLFTGVEFIKDTASNIHANITYESTIKIANISYGEEVGNFFGNYVVENYIEEAEPQQQTYVVNNEFTTSGTKSQVNAALQNVWFTPYRDNNASFDILYTQKRYVNGVLESTQALDIDVADISATARLEVNMGSANSNIQYFVSDEFSTGVDVTQTRAQILTNGINTSLTPRQIISNMKAAYGVDSSLTNYQDYQAPFTIFDTYDEDSGESKYRFIVTNDNFPSGVSLATSDSGWLTRTQMASFINDGIMVTGMTDANVPPHNTQYTVTFKIDRQLFSGIEETIFDSVNNTLTYQFLTGAKVYKHSADTSSSNYIITESRIDNLTSSDLTVYFNDEVDEDDPDLTNTPIRDKIKIKTQDSIAFVNFQTPSYNIPNGIIDYGTGFSLTVYGMSFTFGSVQNLSYQFEWDTVQAANLEYMANNKLAFESSSSTTNTDRGIHIFYWSPWGASIRFGQYTTGGQQQQVYYPSDVNIFVTR